jgi:hypothetical protein
VGSDPYSLQRAFEQLGNNPLFIAITGVVREEYDNKMQNIIAFAATKDEVAQRSELCGEARGLLYFLDVFGTFLITLESEIKALPKNDEEQTTQPKPIERQDDNVPQSYNDPIES